MPVIVMAVLLTRVVVAQDIIKLPDKIGKETTCLNPEFLLYRPKGVDASKKAPLLVYLHGMAWRGRNIKLVKRVGGWGLFSNAKKHKLLLVMPQCDIDVRGGAKRRGRWNTDDLNLLVEYLKENYRIDEDRIYLTGYSMGGFGTWASAIAYPKRFAAIAPIAGGGDPQKAEAIKHLPIWVFHGQKDTRVPHKRSEDMVKALKSKGATKVKFTSYPDQGHNRVLGLAINHLELYKWLLSHSRGKSARPIRKPKAKTRPSPKPLTLDLGKGVTLKLVLIPAGKFVMGTPKTEAGRDDDESPQREVAISKPFYLGVYEVTQDQWRAVMGTEPWSGKAHVKSGPGYPVGYLEWEDADRFCKTLSRKTGRRVVLPTEAQWEYASRAGSKAAYCFGDDLSKLDEYAWHLGNAWKRGEAYGHVVGLKKPNAWGLYDMHGNMYEWCRDWHSGDFLAKAKSVDPENTTDTGFRVLRGGSISSAAKYSRSGNRGGNSRGNKLYRVGFRVSIPAGNVE